MEPTMSRVCRLPEVQALRDAVMAVIAGPSNLRPQLLPTLYLTVFFKAEFFGNAGKGDGF